MLVFASTSVTMFSKYNLYCRIDVAKQLIGGYCGRKRASTPAVSFSSATLQQHTSGELKRKRSTCKWCSNRGEKKRKETKFGCVVCNIHLCKGGCFQAYHLQHAIDTNTEVQHVLMCILVVKAPSNLMQCLLCQLVV